MNQLIFQTIGSNKNPALFFFPGFMGFGSDFLEIAKLLSKDYFSILINYPDFSNLDEKFYSDKKTSLINEPEIILQNNILANLKELGKQIKEIVDQFNISSYTFIGYSMGARVSMALKALIGLSPVRMFLESFSPGIDFDAERIERRTKDKILSEKISHDFRRKFIIDWYQQSLFIGIDNDKKRFEKLITSRLENDANHLVSTLSNFGQGTMPSLWKYLPKLDCPVMVIVGKKDTKYMAITDQLKACSELISVEIIDDTSHNIHFSKPDEFTEQLLKFLIEKRI